MRIKKLEFKLSSITTEKLTSNQIKQICTLKNSHYNYGLKSNIKWFKKNCKKKDIHNLFYINSVFINIIQKKNFFY